MLFKKKKVKRSELITIAIQKGGVGKSTLSVQLCFYLTRFQKGKVLFIDLDSQGNSSTRLTTNKRRKDFTDEFTKSHWLFSERNVETEKLNIESTQYGVDVLRANSKDSDLLELQHADYSNAVNLKENLEKFGLLEKYTHIVMDTPPNVDLRSVAPIAVSNYLLMPLEMAAFAECGMEDMFEDAIYVQEEINPDLTILGFIANKVNRKSKDHIDGLKVMREEIGDMLIKQVIGIRTPIDHVTSRGMPIWELKTTAGRAAAKELKAVFDEVVKRMKKEESKK